MASSTLLIPRILLVEDNLSYSKAATMALSDRAQISNANDYETGLSLLTSDPKWDGVITDCFFPEKTGSGKRELGREVIARLTPETQIESAIVAELAKYVNLTEELEPLVRRYAIAETNDNPRVDPEKLPPPRAIAKVSGVLVEAMGDKLGKEAATKILTNTFSMAYARDNPNARHYGIALRSALEKDEANQPLGVLIAEKATGLGLPVVLATSTYHHDHVTQPIQNEAGRRGWTLVDCAQNKPDEKATPQFWERVFSALEHKQ